MAVVRGADGCAGGWFCASLDLETGKVSAQVFPNAQAMFSDNASVITAIDIPIGLPGVRARGCDSQARALLGPRASAVFPAPVRASLTTDSYESACDRLPYAASA